MAKKKDNLFYRALYYIILVPLYAVSLLPMWWHYFWSDVFYLLIYRVVRYRRHVVRHNLTASFPDKSEAELRKIEREFYHYFCDLLVEAVKFISITPDEMRRRMKFEQLEPVIDSCRRGKSCAIYLGHYGNWEWISSMPLWYDPSIGIGTQLYHPLENPTMDRLMGYIRQRMGSFNIPVEQSVRHIVRYRQQGIPVLVGFIADQVPHWRNIHYWTPFLNHPKTPIFTGAERLTRQFDMDAYYVHIERLRRGYWKATCKLMARDCKQTKEFEITELYTRMLEKNILEAPQYWLWTHNRWKRTYEEWLAKQESWQKKPDQNHSE
ncbi:MAG: lysophospholipid acyltransferase family protein [Bacteroidales bacterium]|nr:lysophospholipid acyltransferase family protein [Bacteroidales bacterium]